MTKLKCRHYAAGVVLVLALTWFGLWLDMLWIRWCAE